MKNAFKEKRGITLIALVITIIVLLILAGVSIAMLTGQNGILSQAENAKVQQSHSSVVEAIKLEYNNWQIEQNTSNSRSIFLEDLLNKNYVDSSGAKIIVENLVGNKLSLGNGTDTDIYILYPLNESYEEYSLIYIEQDRTPTELYRIEKGDSSLSFTEEDEQNSMKYFTTREEVVTAEIKETMGYDDTISIGDTVVVINGIIEDYYHYVHGYTTPIPEEKLVIPNRINGYPVAIRLDNDRMVGCLTSVSTIIYNNDYGMFKGATAKNIKLPDKEKELGFNDESGEPSRTMFRQISTSSENLYYTTENGILYNKDKSVLVKYPALNSNKELTIPETVEEISEGAFAGSIFLSQLKIPNTVTKIGENAFKYCLNIKITVQSGSSLTWSDFENTGITQDRVTFE